MLIIRCFCITPGSHKQVGGRLLLILAGWSVSINLSHAKGARCVCMYSRENGNCMHHCCKLVAIGDDALDAELWHFNQG